jgi:YD repeat-containing protein
VGNPCNPANGNKLEQQVVYSGLNGFGLVLTFNSFDPAVTRFGRHWRDSFERRVQVDGADVVTYRADGKALRFTPSGSNWVTDADTADRLIELKDAGGTRIGWQFQAASGDELETYDAAGKPVTLQSRSGLSQTLTYSDGTGGPNGGFVLDANGNPTAIPLPAGLLIRASDHFGRVLAFGYNSESRVVRMTDPAGGTYRFTYATSRMLVSIEFPDQKVRTYVYNEPANTGGADLLGALTGIIDENGVRYATFQYDSQQRSVSTEHALGALRYTFQYTTGSTTVTDPLSTARTYSFGTVFGAFKNTGITGPACPDCGPASQTFDANGNVETRTDWNGNRTNYSYDLTRNLETSRTEGLTGAGATTPQTRTISTQWDATFRLPTGVAEPLRITTNVYDADGTACGARGALCSRTIQATSDADGSQAFSAPPVGAPRTWSYTYNANGSVLTMDGPRTDVSDLTTYTYYASDDPDLGKRGNLASITNAAGHVTSITAYNEHGQPLTIIDPNGLTTTLDYNLRQRLTSRTVGTETTSYEYDGVGQLTKITLPDGSFLRYTYDAAHRLTGMQDNLGNRIAYTLDAMGNRTQEQVFDPGNNLAQTRSRVFNSLNRLFQEIGAQNQTTQYGYDDQGNVTSVDGPLAGTEDVTTNVYDALNRLRQVTDPGLGVTQYAYNGLDALTSVTDPRNLTTGYTVDGLGNLTLQQSPDTGNTANTYDAGGNLLTQTDAKGQVTSYAYDALNRVTLITFHDGSKQAYAYDQGANGLGRLSSITETDPANNVTSVIAYAYDPHGRVTGETRTLAGQSYVTAYSYDSAGRLEGMTYPSGRTVAYGFDALGRVSAVTTTKPGESPEVVVQGVAYHPFGGVTGFTFGNGQVYSRSVDQDGRIASYSLGAQSYGIGYDAASRIEFISEVGNPANSNSYGYDALDRLIQAVLPSTNYAYGYDAVGNRSTKTAGASTDTYAYSATSNRLASITPASGPSRSFTFDANGSTLADGVNTYVYDTRGRMVQAVSSLGTTAYQVNALGQRIRKTNSLGDRVFHYDTRGRLIAETDPGGGVKREYLYLGDIPVGVVQ